MSLALVLSFSPTLALNKNFPYERADRIMSEANLVDRYFDAKLTKDLFLNYSKNAYSQILTKALELKEASIKSAVPFKISIAPTGVFFELSKYDNTIMTLLKKLQSIDAVEFLGTSFYSTMAPLAPNTSDEVEEQVRNHIELFDSSFKYRPNILVLPHLFYNDRLARVAQKLSFKAVLTEEVGELNDHRYSFVPSGMENMKVLVRNYALSQALYEGRLEELLAEGNDGIAYLEAERLSARGPNYAGMLLESAYRSGKEMIGLSRLLDSAENGVLTVPEQLTAMDRAYGSGPSSIMRNKFQRASMDRLYYLKQYLYELGDQRNIAIWRLLQQDENIIEMDHHIDGKVSNFVDGDDAKLAFWSIYSDFEGKVASKVQAGRRTKQMVAGRYGAQKPG